MDTLKCAVIGLGMGRNHVKGFQLHDGAEVVAVVDMNPKRLDEVGDLYGVANRYASADELFEKEKLDVVSIATPNSLHKPLALRALQQGAHVLCEKPMALNAEEAEEMIAAAKQADRRIMINFSYRFNPVSWSLKRLVDNGALGEIYAGRTRWMRRDGMPGFGGWFGQKELSGGGPLIDLGVHRIDLALWLMGYPKPSYVLAKTHHHLAKRKAKEAGAKIDVEDFASAVITFENGMVLQVEVSWASHIKDKEDMETVLLGTEGGLRQNNLNGRYEFSSSLYREELGCKMDVELQGGVDAPPSAMYHFIESILLDKPHIAGAEEGLYVMRLLDAIYRSSSEGKPIAL